MSVDESGTFGDSHDHGGVGARVRDEALVTCRNDENLFATRILNELIEQSRVNFPSLTTDFSLESMPLPSTASSAKPVSQQAPTPAQPLMDQPQQELQEMIYEQQVQGSYLAMSVLGASS